MSRRHARVLAVALLAILGLIAAGCGGGEAEPAPPAETQPAAEPPAAEPAAGATELQLAADPGGALAFDTTSLEAPAGEVSIVFTNDSPLPHNVSIEGNGVDVEGETITGGTATTTATLEPGTYELYCSVPGHKDGGMVGTLTVS